MVLPSTNLSPSDDSHGMNLNGNNHSPNKRKADELTTTQIVDEVAAAAAAEPDDFDDEGSKDEDGKGTRRFFPRVKHLLTPDYEPVSSKMLECNEY